MVFPIKQNLWVMLLLTLTMVLEAQANPVFAQGVWKNITPTALNLNGTFGTPGIAIDPTNTSTLYLCSDTKGLWKTTDGGSNWIRLGNPPATPDYGTSVEYLDSPVQIGVDPNNANHLWATQGVRGITQGFWESQDGGVTWKQPIGFIAISAVIGTRDITMLEIDPGNFNHVLLGSHGNWVGTSSSGILESRDGGITFVAHPPALGFTSGSMGVHILRYLALGIGNDSTWLVQTDGNGFFRTTNRGNVWTKVSDFSSPHAPPQIYYSKDGTIYSGGYQYPCRSNDNGITWQQVSAGIPYAYYSGIVGDGNFIYTMKSYAANSPIANDPYSVLSEINGNTWKDYNPLGTGVQKFENGPGTMVFDKVNRIVYGAHWTAGLWALKVIDSETGISKNEINKQISTAYHLRKVYQVISGLNKQSISQFDILHDTNGKRINNKNVGDQVLMIKPK